MENKNTIELTDESKEVLISSLKIKRTGGGIGRRILKRDEV
jgi:hypothetical protein